MLGRTLRLAPTMFALAVSASAQIYHQVNLVSDLTGVATLTDPSLVNPWGMSFSSGGPFWISNAGSSTSTIYTVTGSSTVTKTGSITTPAAPSGQVSNSSSGFVISQGGASGPATFLFAELNGTIAGWNAKVPPPVPPATSSTQAIVAATGAPAPVAYTGLAMATRAGERFLYAANNATGRVDVFDHTFTQVTLSGTPFIDSGVPAGNLPFNIVNVRGSLYVTYSGPAGIVNIFDTEGRFVKRFATGGTLANPWGIAVAPADFGKFSKAVLIGNFNFGNPATGPGNISAFDTDGTFLGLLEDTTGKPLSIDGLWSLKFGNGKNGGATNVLYFTAGVQNQTHGIFGRLAACGPVISGASASPDTLSPPNNKMVAVTLNYAVADDCDTAPAGSISITSNEGTSADWQIVDLHHVNLLASRTGNGGDRIYTITITYKDAGGLSSSAVVKVTVPHDQGQGNQGDGGDQGDQGDQGDHGDHGNQGGQGNQGDQGDHGSGKHGDE